MTCQVIVGRIEFVLGQLEYQKFEHVGSEYWVVGVAIGGGSLLTVVMVILIVYKRKSTRAQRQFRRLQQQLDSLESNIRNECKQGERHDFSLMVNLWYTYNKLMVYIVVKLKLFLHDAPGCRRVVSCETRLR